MEGNGHDLIKISARNLRRRTEKYQETPEPRFEPATIAQRGVEV